MIGSPFTNGQLQSKINNLENRYEIMLARKGKSGRGDIKWPYLERMEALFGWCAWAKPKATADKIGPTKINSDAEPIARKA
nr:unnamed protein product [Callosobruchus chinensis]